MIDAAELLRDAADRTAAYLTGLDERDVFPGPAELGALERFGEALPDGPTDPAQTLALLDEMGSPATVGSAGGRYFGFVNGGTLPAALACHVLATGWDQNAALEVMSPVTARLHRVVERWLVDVFGLAPETSAFFVGGATVANLCGLLAGRDTVLARAGWDVAGDGLVGAPPVSVLVGEHAHSTIVKSLSIIGLGRNRVEVVPADEQGRLMASALPDADGPVIVSTQAGDVNTGAFDPFDDIVGWARDRNAWVHVDGAFGLWAAASANRRHLTAGMAGADSWATDGHKWLNVPYDSGIVLVRDPAALASSMSAAAGYLPGGTLEAMHHTPQSSQRARAVDAWAAMRSLGRTGLSDLVDRCSDHARRFADGLAAGGHEVLNEVVINQVLVAFGSDERTDDVIEAVQQSGECWCGPTTFRGRRAMRISVSSWATTEVDVDRALAAILTAAA